MATSLSYTKIMFGTRFDQDVNGFQFTSFSSTQSSTITTTIGEVPKSGGGDPDAVFTPGETIHFSLGGGPQQAFTFYGTVQGNPVVEDSGGTLFVLHNDLPLGVYPVNNIFVLPVCFLPGTLIATPGGEVAVEALAIGDLILTADGRAVPVRWIGRQSFATRFGPAPNALPVVIQAGALAPGLPRRDLRVTGGHALMLDGVAVEAGALVNGGSIRRMSRAELGARFTVFHIETEGHEVILAEGAEAETYLGHGDRSKFDNAAEHAALYGEVAMQDMPQPRAMSQRQVPAAVQARIAARAATLRAA